MSNLALFQRFWRDYLNRLDKIVSAQGARLVAPDQLQFVTRDDGSQWVSLLEPVMLYNTPYKAGSRKGTAKRAIFVDGTFCFRNDDTGAELLGASCNLLVYDTQEVAGESYALALVDSLHFDMEKAQAQKDFHPMFHVQRGYSTLISPHKVRERARFATKLTPEKVTLDDRAQSVENLRLPTPQMDLLSVLSTVVADFFCHEDSSRAEKDAFYELLKALMDVKNPALCGSSAQVLERRWGVRPPFAAAHWYREGSGLGRPGQAPRFERSVAGPA